MQALLNRREQQYLKSQAPQMVRAANPYQDIPSLYDMYLQATPRPAIRSDSEWTFSRTPCKTPA